MTPRARVEAIDKEIGQRLREFRFAAGMTQQQLATPIGVSSVQIQKYERGENRIAVATLVHLCKALNLSPMDFLGPYFEAMEPTDSADSQTTETAKHVEHPSSPQHKLREGRGTRHWLKKPRRR